MKQKQDDGSVRVVSQPRFVPPGSFPLRPDFHRWIYGDGIVELIDFPPRWWFYFYYTRANGTLEKYCYPIGDDDQKADWLNAHYDPPFVDVPGEPCNGYLFEYFIRDNFAWQSWAF